MRPNDKTPSPAEQLRMRFVRNIDGDLVLVVPAFRPRGNGALTRAEVAAFRRRMRDGLYEHPDVLRETARRILASRDV